MSTRKRKRKPKVDWVNETIELIFVSVIILIATVWITTFIDKLK